MESGLAESELKEVQFQCQKSPACIVKWRVKPGSRFSQGTILLFYKDGDGQTEDNQSLNLKKWKAVGMGTVISLLKQEGDIIHNGCPILQIKACSHPVVMKDMCAECGADLREKNEKEKESIASVPMIHCIPELMVSKEQAQILGKADEERLFKDRKLVLLVDLDQTLIHTTNDEVDPNLKDVYHFQMYGPNSPWFHTKIRPGTRQFLENISQMYELHICTFGSRLYAHTIVQFLDNGGKYFSYRILSRDECFSANSKTANLSALFPCGDHLVCIIDDREDVWNFAPNLVHVKPYHYFQHTGDINAPPGLTKTDLDEKTADVRVGNYKRSKRAALKMNERSFKRLKSLEKVDEKEKLSDKDETPDSPLQVASTYDQNTQGTRIETPDECEANKIVSFAKDENISLGECDTVKNELIDEEMKDESAINLGGGDTIKNELIDEEMKDESAINLGNNCDTVNIEPTNEEMKDESSINLGDCDTIKHKPINEERKDEKDINLEECDTVTNKSTAEETKDESTNNSSEVKTTKNTNVDNKIQVENSEAIKIDNYGSEEVKPIADEVKKQSTKNSSECVTAKINVEKKFKEAMQIDTNESKYAKKPSTKEPDLEKGDDHDDYLLYLTDILTSIYREFYGKSDQLKAVGSTEVPDLKTIVPLTRKKVLEGCNIVFSGVIPINMPLEKSKAYFVAKNLGAQIQKNLTVSNGCRQGTTHVVAARIGTVKVIEAKKAKGIHVVTPDWLWCCSERWERVDEKLFPLTKDTTASTVFSSKELLKTPQSGSLTSSEGKENLGTSETSNAEAMNAFPTYDPVTGKRVNKTAGANSVASTSSFKPVAGTSSEQVSKTNSKGPSFATSINPMLTFTSEDIVKMGQEVDDEMDDSESDESVQSSNMNIEESLRQESSSSGESLSSDYPRKWAKNFEEGKKDTGRKMTQDEENMPRFPRSELPHDSDRSENEADNDSEYDFAESIGSVDEEMAAAVEREFLNF